MYPFSPTATKLSTAEPYKSTVTYGARGSNSKMYDTCTNPSEYRTRSRSEIEGGRKEDGTGYEAGGGDVIVVVVVVSG